MIVRSLILKTGCCLGLKVTFITKNVHPNIYHVFYSSDNDSINNTMSLKGAEHKYFDAMCAKNEKDYECS